MDDCLSTKCTGGTLLIVIIFRKMLHSRTSFSIFITSTAATYLSPDDCINTACRTSLTIGVNPAETVQQKTIIALAQYLLDIQLYSVWDSKFLCILGSNMEVFSYGGEIPSIAFSWWGGLWATRAGVLPGSIKPRQTGLRVAGWACYQYNGRYWGHLKRAWTLWMTSERGA